MRKSLAILALLALGTACGISSGAMLYPVAGPLFDTRAPAIEVFFTGAMTGAGNVQFKMPDGETIRGQFRTMTGYSSSTDFGPGPAGGPQATMTKEDWNAVYGSPDMAVGQINGQMYGVGDRGTVVRGEYIVDPVNSRGHGVAKDSKGNLYRIVINVVTY